MVCAQRVAPVLCARSPHTSQIQPGVCVCEWLCECTCVCSLVCKRACVLVHMCVCAHLCVCVCINARAHTDTDTHCGNCHHPVSISNQPALQLRMYTQTQIHTLCRQPLPCKQRNQTALKLRMPTQTQTHTVSTAITLKA